MFEKRRFILATGIGSRRNRSIIKLLVSTPEAWRKSAPGERNVASHRGLVKLEKHTPKACEEKLPQTLVCLELSTHPSPLFLSHNDCETR